MGYEPKDVEGECNACLFIADNYGDNHTTMRCGLFKGHEGPHREKFTRSNGEQEVVVTWTIDESVICEKHGRVSNPCYKCDYLQYIKDHPEEFEDYPEGFEEEI